MKLFLLGLYFFLASLTFACEGGDFGTQQELLMQATFEQSYIGTLHCTETKDNLTYTFITPEGYRLESIAEFYRNYYNAKPIEFLPSSAYLNNVEANKTEARQSQQAQIFLMHEINDSVIMLLPRNNDLWNYEHVQTWSPLYNAIIHQIYANRYEQ